MSLTRQFFREFRPLFRMLEEPLRQPGFAGMPARAFFDDPFFTAPTRSRPAVDLSEEGNYYIVEAELPGVKKEDVDVRIGDGGQSVIIEGNIVQRRVQPTTSAEEGAELTCTPSIDASTAVAKQDQTNQLSVERAFTGSTTFTRTVWLPRPVDANNVSAKLADGILTLRIPKAVEAGSVKVNVE
ncbi:HSP20-like chaperone [Artomyces pyxidatus]|uniref:HSP20-like chaperone n=1 Tax=Artomyces pyxidatus TaxID=48021 RepID=A0ACB8T0R3_9AGAM|nr:HSP20-like chaperone [Artomyces pyxidatus]